MHIGRPLRKMAGVGMKRIGITRSLYYYIDPFDWECFFKILGFSIVLSESVSDEYINKGIKTASSDQCFPIKLFYAHVLSLKDRVDYLFIPQLVCLKKGTYSCPKIICLPFLINNTITIKPEILYVSIDLANPFITICKVFFFALKLIKNPFRIKKAMQYFNTKLKSLTLIPSLESRIIQKKTIGIIGHKYALNDNLLNMNLVEKVKSFGFDVLTLQDMDGLISPSLKSSGFFNCRAVHWDFGQDIISTADYFLKNENITGIIFLTFFGCGIDAFVEEIFKTNISKTKPYLCISMDEHTGEAGFMTRLEAFLDMIIRKEMA